MIRSNKRKKARRIKLVPLLLSGLIIAFIQIIIFANLSYSTENLTAVPLGFRTHSEIEVGDEMARSGLIPKKVRQSSPVVQAGDVTGQEPAEGMEELSVPSEPKKITVPNLIGLAKEGAAFSIGKSGLTIGRIIDKNHETIPSGKVIGQTPVSGRKVDLENPVDLIISSGPSLAEDSMMGRLVQKTGKGKPGNLKWKNKPLGEILNEVQSDSGIQFKAPSSIKEEIITMEIDAPTWRTAIKKMLKGYSTAQIFDSHGNLVKVRIMSDQFAKNTISRRFGGASGGKAKFKSEGKAKITSNNLAGKKKKKKLIRPISKVFYGKLKDIKVWPKDQPLPSSMYNDSDLKAFFSANGIASAKDLEESQKITKLKRAARKQLLIMRKRAQASDIDLE